MTSIKNYDQWVKESQQETLQTVEVGDMTVPILPEEVWKELGDKMIDTFKSHYEKIGEKRDLGVMLNYLVYQTPADQGRDDNPSAKPHVSSAQLLSRADGKNILNHRIDHRIDSFTYVVGIGAQNNLARPFNTGSEFVQIFEKVARDFARQSNLIIKIKNYEGKHSVFLFPEKWRGALIGKEFGI